MLDPWIIEEIRRREEDERREHERQQPVLEITYELPVVPTGKAPEDSEERGVVIVDFSL